MNTYVKEIDLNNYLSNQKESINKMIADIDQTWPHSKTIEAILKDSLDEINKISNKNSENKIVKHERKIEKYLNWVEVYRLANYHYGKYMDNKLSYSEGLFSTLLALSSIHIDSKNIKKIGIIGCGPGRSVLDFSFAYPNATIYGLDYSIISLMLGKNIVSTNKEVEIIRRNYDNNSTGVSIDKIKGFNRQNCEWGLYDLTKSNLKDEYDLVVCSNVINLMPNHKMVINNVYKMLKKGGYLIYADLTGWRLDRNKEQTLMSDRNSINNNFEKYGFKTIECFEGGPYLEQENNSCFSFYKECYYIGRKN